MVRPCSHVHPTGTSSSFRPASLLLFVLPLALLPACSSSQSAQANRDAEWILDVGRQRTLDNRERDAVRPQERPPATEAEAPLDVDGVLGQFANVPAVGEVRVEKLSLARALAIAVETSRSYLTEREGLLLQALTLSSTRRTFSPRLAATLGGVFADGDSLRASRSVNFDAGVTQILPWGGSAALDLSSGLDYPGGPSPLDRKNFDTRLALRVSQPLLRGFGREVTLNPLIQSERDLVYRIRAFERFRESFSIDVASRFYDLVSQRQAIENQRQNLDGFIFNRRKAEALFAVGRTRELEVLRARRSELSSRNDLIGSQESYQLALDRFRIFLGMPGDIELDVEPEPPEFVPTNFELVSAIEVALENRLDYLTEIERVEDVERSVRIARNGLRPDLDLDLAYGLGTAGGSLNSETGSFGGVEHFDDQNLDRDDYSMALSLGLPLDRLQERNSVRSAEIALIQARRALEQFRDNLIVEIERAFRELRRREQSLAIQRQLIEDQEKNAKIAALRFEQGDFSNRDLVEAETALLDARNTLIREQVAYEIARLSLLRDLGILFIDDEGMWVE